MGKRVILTGGTGFVGANLARRLLDDGHETHLLVRPSYRSWRIEPILADLQLHEVRLANHEALARAVRDIRPDWIFHLATHGAYASQTDLRQMVQTNIVATVNLVEACLETGFESFVNTGSSSEYGLKDHPPSETEPLEPNSRYGVTKASATMFCRYTAQEKDVHLPTLRLYSVFGPYEEPTRLFPALIRCGKEGRLPPLVDPTVARDFIYVDDVIDAYCLTASRPGSEKGAVYNLGTGVSTTIRDVTEIARRLMRIEEAPQWGTMPNRSWDTDVWVADPTKIRSALGWHPRYSLEKGFSKLLQWFDDHPTIMDFYRRNHQEPM